MTPRSSRCLTLASLSAALWLLVSPLHSIGAAAQRSWYPSTANSCQVSATGLAFGVYSVFSNSPLDSVGTVRLNCSSRNGNATFVEISFGPGETGTVGDRYMTASPFDDLEYQIYADASRRTVLGDGSQGSTTLSANINSNRTFTIYGRVFARQDVYPGDYRDSVRVTITF